MLTPEANEFYDESLRRATSGPASTGYGHPINQELRFNNVWRLLFDEDFIDEETQLSVLDVGCGTGDLLTFLQKWDLSPDYYLGVDAHEGMWLQARKNHPDHVFMNGSISDVPSGRSFTLVTALGVFAHKPEGWDRALAMTYIQDQILEMADRSHGAVMVTLWSTWKNAIGPTELVVDPAEIFNWAMQRFGRVEINHTYAPHDFTLTIYVEEGRWWEEYENRRDP